MFFFHLHLVWKYSRILDNQKWFLSFYIVVKQVNLFYRENGEKHTKIIKNNLLWFVKNILIRPCYRKNLIEKFCWQFSSEKKDQKERVLSIFYMIWIFAWKNFNYFLLFSSHVAWILLYRKGLFSYFFFISSFKLTKYLKLKLRFFSQMSI